MLLAYAKIWLTDEVGESTLPDDPWVARALVEYFPEKLRQTYASYMDRHPLRREIITTVIVNQTVNRVGPSFAHRLREATATQAADVVRAHLLTREAFGLRELWAGIEALDARVADEVQARMLIDVGRLMISASSWFLRSRRLREDMATTVSQFAPGIAAIASRVSQLLHGAAQDDAEKRVASLVADSVPEDLARRVATIDAQAGALDIVEIAASLGQDVPSVAAVYYQLGGRLGLDAIAQRIEALPAEGHWQALAKSALSDDLAELQRVLTKDVVALPAAARDATERIGAWEATNSLALRAGEPRRRGCRRDRVAGPCHAFRGAARAAQSGQRRRARGCLKGGVGPG